MALQARHSHGMSHMDMSDMDGMTGMDDMGSTTYNNFTLQQDFWVFIGSVIAFATLVNVLDKILLHQRLRSRNAKPTSLFWESWATTTAIGRELFSASLRPLNIKGSQVRSVIAGPVAIVIAYSIAVIVFTFIGTDPSDSWNWENVAVQVGYTAQTQLPLLFLLAGKQNIIGWFTGIGYERLNWLHRWISRIVWITVTMHMGFFFRSWARWDYIKVKLATDNMTQTGFAGWCILTAVFLLSFAPVRRWNYEFFIISHIVLFAGFTDAVMIHVDDGIAYIWTCVGLYLFDRVARFLVACYCNIGLFRGKTLWANHATLTPLPGNVTRITIDKPLVSWSTGQHMFLSCHTIVPLQSHPFTIASLPSDEKMEFLVQARNGGTKRYNRWASKYERLPDSSVQRKMVGVEGPYGQIRPLRQFDSVVLLAGGTGATFTVPLVRDLVELWGKGSPTTTRTIRLIWAIKSRDRLSWFQSQLEQAIVDVDLLRQKGVDVELDISVYITCDDQLAQGISSQCEPETMLGEVQMVTQAEQIPMIKEKETINAIEVDASSTASSSCGADGKCCCRSVVDDEKTPTTCCCCKPTSSASSTRSESRLKVLAGRPHTRNIIRKVLEDAEGESAVLVCGPQGLQDDVRRTVVSLSDERAVHKGTGAQGIYLHVEGFGY